MFLALAIAGLLAGPVLYVVPHRDRWDDILDSFTVSAVGTLCALHLLPEAMEHGGWLAAGLAGIGLILPGLLHGLQGFGPRVLLMGLILHAALESAALGAPNGHGEMGIAVLLHRIPVGLAVFGLYHQHPGNRATGWFAILAMVAATAAGFYGGPAITEAAGEVVEAAINAAVAGMLFHIVWEHGPHHDHDHDHDHGGHHPPVNRSHASGVVTAIATVAGIATALALPDEHHGPGVTGALIELLLGGSPALLVAFGLLAGVGLRGAGVGRAFDRVIPWTLVMVFLVAFSTFLAGWTPTLTLSNAHPVQLAMMVGVLLVVTHNLVRQGPRGMVSQLTAVLGPRPAAAAINE